MKKFLVSSLVSTLILGASALPAQAQSNIVLQSGYQSTTYIIQGQTNTFHAIVQDMTGDPITVLIDLELYDSSDHKVAQTFYDNVTVQPYNIVDKTLVSPSNLVPGTYTWKVGLFGPGWNGLLAWYNDVVEFTVHTNPSQPANTSAVTLSSSALGEFHLNNCPILTALLQNSAPNTQNVLIDIELRDQSGALKNQFFLDDFSVKSTQNDGLVSLSNNCNIKLPNGNYSYSVGIFNPGWNGLVHWYNNVQNFTVAVNQ